MKRIYLSMALMAAVTVFCPACSKSGRLEGVQPVTGVVTYQGSPVTGATVTFSPQGGGVRAAAATTDAQGNFQLTTLQSNDGAMPGEYRVVVTKIETTSTEMTDEEMQKHIEKHGAPPTVESKNLLPEKYAKRDTTDLTATVKQGEKNHFEFALSD